MTTADDHDAGSLRDALPQICPGGTVTFDPALDGGTITLASTLILSRNVTIDAASLGAGINLDGNHKVPVLSVPSGITAKIKQLTAKNGCIPQSQGTDCSGDGNGINNAGILTVENSTITGNIGANGTGIFNTGSLTLIGSTVSNNHMGLSYWGIGGGIYSQGTLVVMGSQISGNDNFEGAGIYNIGVATITASTLADNGSENTDAGGGILNGSGTMTVTNSTFSGNQTQGNGGGILNGSGTMTVTDSTFSGNQAQGTGGAIISQGIHPNPAMLTLKNNTFVDNKIGNGADDHGSAIAVTYVPSFSGAAPADSRLSLTNNLLAGNVGPETCYTSHSTDNITSNVGNLSDDGSCGTALVTSASLNLDTLAVNGGPTQTIALGAGSTAIDTGDDAACTATDQRGVGRPVGAHCDVGAFEYGATPAAPEVSLSQATDISDTGATLNGSANAHDSQTTVTFKYGETNAYGLSASAVQSSVSGHGDTPVSAYLTGLKPNTTYHYRLTAKNSEGSAQSDDATFTTAKTSPTVLTTPASTITATTATLNGQVNAQDDSLAVGFEYGETDAYGTTAAASPSPVSGSALTPVIAALTGLQPNTTYHYRVAVINSADQAFYGADNSFTTAAAAPLATTLAPEGVSRTGATLKGKVNANHDSTAISFEYWADAQEHATVAAAESPLSGNMESTVSAVLTGLAPNTQYTFRVLAVNNAGSAAGEPHTFITGAAPLAITDDATAISPAGATLNASINPSNSSTAIRFEYGETAAYGSSVPAAQSPLTGSVEKPVSAEIAGLKPNTTYHFRVVAQNPTGGITYGQDMTFTTLATPQYTLWLPVCHK